MFQNYMYSRTVARTVFLISRINFLLVAQIVLEDQLFSFSSATYILRKSTEVGTRDRLVLTSFEILTIRLIGI